MVVISGVVIISEIVTYFINIDFCYDKGYNYQTESKSVITCYQLGPEDQVLSSKDYLVGGV